MGLAIASKKAAVFFNHMALLPDELNRGARQILPCPQNSAVSIDPIWERETFLSSCRFCRHCISRPCGSPLPGLPWRFCIPWIPFFLIHSSQRGFPACSTQRSFSFWGGGISDHFFVGLFHLIRKNSPGPVKTSTAETNGRIVTAQAHNGILDILGKALPGSFVHDQLLGDQGGRDHGVILDHFVKPEPQNCFGG